MYWVEIKENNYDWDTLKHTWSTLQESAYSHEILTGVFLKLFYIILKKQLRTQLPVNIRIHYINYFKNRQNTLDELQQSVLNVRGLEIVVKVGCKRTPVIVTIQLQHAYADTNTHVIK